MVVPRRHKPDEDDSESIASGDIEPWKSESGSSSSGGSAWGDSSSTNSSDSSTASVGGWWGLQTRQQGGGGGGGGESNRKTRRMEEQERNQVCNVTDDLANPVVKCIAPAVGTLSFLAPFIGVGNEASSTNQPQSQGQHSQPQTQVRQGRKAKGRGI